ncbi:MAG: helix-turn-helix domain-containing protein [Lachnospiraceae bacterium]|nr:helix-turn-helix domain-containing protein [Lachnospiraceae bacterium]
MAENSTAVRKSLSQTSNLDRRVYALLEDTEGGVQIEAHAFLAGHFRFNWNNALELVMVLKGRLRLCTEDGVFELRELDFALVNINKGHAGLQEEFGTIVLTVLLSPDYLRRLCGFIPRFGRCSSIRRAPDEKEIPEEALVKIRRDLASLFRDLSQDRPDNVTRLMTHAHVCRMLGLLLRWFEPEEQNAEENVLTAEQKKRSRLMTRYIDQQFRNDLKLTEMADVFKMNASYLSDYFRRCTGMSFHEYLTRKRLQYAVLMLNNTENTVLEIALDAGFPNNRSFRAAFRKYLGMSAGEYRKEISRRGRINLGSSSVLPADDPDFREIIDSLYDRG